MKFYTSDGIKTELTFNDDGSIDQKTSQDVEPALVVAHEMRGDEDSSRKREEFRCYAKVPIIFVESWMREYGITDMGKALTEIMFRKVNSDFTAFKTTNTTERVAF